MRLLLLAESQWQRVAVLRPIASKRSAFFVQLAFVAAIQHGHFQGHFAIFVVNAGHGNFRTTLINANQRGNCAGFFIFHIQDKALITQPNEPPDADPHVR